MNKKSIGILLIVALIAAAGALALDRSLFWPSADAIDRDVQLLEDQLAESRAQRDSLNALIARHEDSLQALKSAAQVLSDDLAGKQVLLDRQNALLIELRNQSLQYDLPPDSLLNDLNTILLSLPSGDSADGSRR